MKFLSSIVFHSIFSMINCCSFSKFFGSGKFLIKLKKLQVEEKNAQCVSNVIKYHFQLWWSHKKKFNYPSHNFLRLNFKILFMQICSQLTLDTFRWKISYRISSNPSNHPFIISNPAFIHILTIFMKSTSLRLSVKISDMEKHLANTLDFNFIILRSLIEWKLKYIISSAWDSWINFLSLLPCFIICHLMVYIDII